MPYPDDWRVPLDEDKNVLGMLRPFVDNMPAIVEYILPLEQDRAIACMAYVVRDDPGVLRYGPRSPFVSKLIMKHHDRLHEIIDEQNHKQAADEQAEKPIQT